MHVLVALGEVRKPRDNRRVDLLPRNALTEKLGGLHGRVIRFRARLPAPCDSAPQHPRNAFRGGPIDWAIRSAEVGSEPRDDGGVRLAPSHLVHWAGGLGAFSGRFESLKVEVVFKVAPWESGQSHWRKGEHGDLMTEAGLRFHAGHQEAVRSATIAPAKEGSNDVWGIDTGSEGEAQAGPR